jgi:hypothetical protein
MLPGSIQSAYTTELSSRISTIPAGVDQDGFRLGSARRSSNSMLAVLGGRRRFYSRLRLRLNSRSCRSLSDIANRYESRSCDRPFCGDAGPKKSRAPKRRRRDSAEAASLHSRHAGPVLGVRMSGDRGRRADARRRARRRGQNPRLAAVFAVSPARVRLVLLTQRRNRPATSAACCHAQIAKRDSADWVLDLIANQDSGRLKARCKRVPSGCIASDGRAPSC